MDKHERPYRCKENECTMLHGFTYRAGLLRHEREVHKKHGGQRASLMCPEEGCKRSVGVAFTRKSNLDQHVRQVHKKEGEQGNAVAPDESADMAEEGEARQATGFASSPAALMEVAAAGEYELCRREVQELREQIVGQRHEVKELRRQFDEMSAELRAVRQAGALVQVEGAGPREARPRRERLFLRQY